MSRSRRTRSMLARAKAAEAEKQTTTAAKPAATPTPSGGKLGKMASSVQKPVTAVTSPTPAVQKPVPPPQKPQVLPQPRVQTQDIPVPQNIVQAIQGMPNKTTQAMPSGGKTGVALPASSKLPMPQQPQQPQSAQQPFVLPPPQSPFAAQPSNFTAPSWMTAAPQGGIGNLLNQIR